MGFFGFLGSMFFGVMAMGALLVIVVIFFFMSGYYRLRRRARGNTGSPNKSYTSTGRADQRYYGDSDGGSRFRANRYNGPTARRSTGSRQSAQGSAGAKTSSSSSSSSNDVIEVPLLEVVDLPDEPKK